MTINTIAQSKIVVVNPTPAYFGKIPLISTDIIEFTILNTSSSTIDLNEISISGTNSNDFSIIKMPLTSKIGAYGEEKLQIEFKPQNVGESNAILKIQSSVGIIQVPLIGSGTVISNGSETFERILGIESNIDKSKNMQLCQAANGDYIIVASTKLTDKITYDVHLLKTDKYGKLLWYRVFEYGSFGGESWDIGDDVGVSVLSLQDGSIIVLGSTNAGGPGSISVFLSKWDSDGNILWEKTFGGKWDDIPTNIIQDSQGNFVIVGSTNNTSDNSRNTLVMKISPDGSLIWNKNYGTSGIEAGFDIIETSDRGYIIVGNNQNPVANIYFLKIDVDGNQQWSNTLLSNSTTEGNVIRKTKDGGYIVSGYTLTDKLGMQGYIVKVNSSTELQWSKTFGDNNIDFFKSIIETPDGGFLCAGANNRIWTTEYSYDDLWLVQTDPLGNLMWEKFYGGDKSQYAADIIINKDGGYTIAGETGSYREKDRVYLIGINSNGTFTGIKNRGAEFNSLNLSLVQNYPNPFETYTIIKFQIQETSSSHVLLKVYDINGKEIKTLIDNNLTAGYYSVEYIANEKLPNGVYFYNLKIGNNSITKKMILNK